MIDPVNISMCRSRHIYDLAAQGRPAQMEVALERFTSAQRVGDPCALMLRAMLVVLGGDAPGGIRLLQRAIVRSSGPVRSYVLDLLVPLLISSGKIDEAELCLDGSNDAGLELGPHFVALRAILFACRGRRDASRSLTTEAIEHCRNIDVEVHRARVLQRCSLASYYRGDYVDASELGLEAAALYESCGAYRMSAAAYSVPYVVAHALFNDPDLARSYAALIIRNARRAEDLSLVNFGLVAQLDIAADTGDRRRLSKLRRRLMQRPLHQQYGERTSIVIAGVLVSAWSGQFDAARSALTELRPISNPLARRTLCDALIGLCAAATWDLAEARSRARLVLSQTAVESAKNCSDVHSRRVARIVAAATCLIIGDTVRGRRALTRASDKQTMFSQVLNANGVAENCVPEIYRGYARMINAAAHSAIKSQPPLSLSIAELAILRALTDGATLASIAAELGKSRETVKKHVHRIYSKLGIRNRVQAISRARDLRLI